MESKKKSHHKVPNPYDKLNERVVWSPPKKNTSVSASRESYPNTSIVVDPLSVDLSLTSEHTNSLNKRVSEASTILFPFSKSLSSHKTPIAMQPAEVNMSLAGQLVDINIPMPHSQSIEKSAEPIMEPLAIPYDNKQLTDSDLWDSFFAPVLLLGINKFLSSNAQNIACLLFRISTYIK